MCILAGVMLTTAMPPQEGTALLAPLALALFFHALRGAPQAGRAAFYFGLGHAAPLLAWLFYLDPAKSIPTRALVPLQAMATILFVAAHYLLMGLAVGIVRRRWSRQAVLVLLPISFFAVELLRSFGELGFPWCLSGAAWLDTPVQSLYAGAGELGLSAATVMTAAALVAVFDMIRSGPRISTHRWGLVVASAVLWCGLWLGSGPTDPVRSKPDRRTAPLTVAGVQADVTQADKWDDAKIDSTRVPYTELTRRAAAAGAQLVVWAETAVPAYLLYERDLLIWVQGLVRDLKVPLLAGFPDARSMPGKQDDEDNRTWERYNTAGLFSSSGELIARYNKHHLVPLGEAMPFQRIIPWLGRIDVGQAEWTPGPAPVPMILPTEHGSVGLVPLICFEAIFAEYCRRAVRGGGDVLVNITNDGWFGRRAGPLQHAALSRIRAAECGVPLVRSANNGVSLITSTRGDVLTSLDLHRRGFIMAEVDLTPRGTWFVRTGAWPAIGFMLLWAFVGLLLARRDERAAAGAAGSGVTHHGP